MPSERQLEKQQEHLERKQEHIERKMEANERRQDEHERRDFDRSPERRGNDRGGYGDSSTSPVFHPNRRTRILLSPDRGSGWITEAPRSASDAFLVWMLTYEPLVRALEHRDRRERVEEILEDFHRECRIGYHMERIRTPRADDLVVREVDEPFEIKEHDGKERIEHVNKMELMARRKVIRM